jgi:hypothetical protein
MNDEHEDALDPENITRFEEAAAKILALAYLSFPSEARIDIFGFSGTTQPQLGQPTPKEAVFVRDTVLWLCDAGFLRMKSKSTREDRLNPVLTAKAYEVLRGAPFTGQPKKTLGESIVEVANAGAKEGAIETRRAIISEIIKLGIRVTLGA